jgi:predicted acetyltransferase
MDDFRLVQPTKEHEIGAKEYIQEFRNYNSPIEGSGGLGKYNDYDEWLIQLHNNLDMNNIAPGKVPSNTYFLIREEDNKIIGMINIRHYLNEKLLKDGGHISYSIRPTERQKGYATMMLYLGLLECFKLGLDKVLVTCDKDNIGSAKTIQANYGMLENEIHNSNLADIVQRYWIDVNEVLERGEPQWKKKTR